MEHVTQKIVIEDFVNRVRTVAAQRPDDQEALRRARVAVRFYRSFCSSCPTPQLQPLRHVSVFPVQTHRRGVTLPTETCMQIIGYVSDWIEREGTMRRSEETKTLMSLARTCKLFQHIAEGHIYRLLPFRGRFSDVWRFHFSISVEPRRTTLVRSLYIWWGDEYRRLIDVVRTCPNLSSLALRWVPERAFQDLTPDYLEKHAESMKELLQSCPQVRTFKFSGASQTHRGIAAPDMHVAQFYKELTELETVINYGWAMHALSHYDFSNITVLSLRHTVPNYRVHSSCMIPPGVYQSIPGLRKLVLEAELADFVFLRRACAAWGSSLQHFCLHTKSRICEDVVFLISYLPVLEELLILDDGFVNRQMIEGITKHSCLKTSRLRTIVLGGLDRWSISRPYLWREEPVDQALQCMIDALHPTLETLYLGHHRPVQRPCLKHLKQATNLRRLRIHIEEDAKQEDIDELAECTKLQTLQSKKQLTCGEYLYLVGGEPCELQSHGYERGWGENTW
ncbi:hypothetical protein ACHAP8_011505 [Fusarium lateritium]